MAFFSFVLGFFLIFSSNFAIAQDTSAFSSYCPRNEGPDGKCGPEKGLKKLALNSEYQAKEYQAQLDQMKELREELAKFHEEAFERRDKYDENKARGIMDLGAVPYRNRYRNRVQTLKDQISSLQDEILSSDSYNEGDEYINSSLASQEQSAGSGVFKSGNNVNTTQIKTAENTCVESDEAPGMYYDTSTDTVCTPKSVSTESVANTKTAKDFATALVVFQSNVQYCANAISQDYKQANTCCAVGGKACDLSEFGAQLLGLGASIINGNLVGVASSLGCGLVQKENSQKAKSLQTVVRKCEEAKTSIAAMCNKNLGERMSALNKAAEEADAAIQPPATPTYVSKAQSAIAGVSIENVTLQAKTVTVTNSESWDSGHTSNAIAAEKFGIYTQRAEKELKNCQKQLSDGLTVASGINKFLKKNGNPASNPTNLPPLQFPDIATLPDSNSPVIAGVSNRSLYGDDELDGKYKAQGTDHKDGGSNNSNPSNSSPGYASAAGLSGGSGGGGGSSPSGQAKASASGPSSLLKGFSNKSYSGRVGVVRGGSYRGARRGSRYLFQAKKSSKKRSSFNLKDYLPGGKKDPKRSLASGVGPMGGNIFRVMSNKFKAVCISRQLFDCEY